MKRIAVCIVALLVACGCTAPPTTRSLGTTRAATPGVQLPPLLVDVEHQTLRLRPVDPRTLADLHTPIEIGHHFAQALSPNGQQLAVIAWPSGAHNRDGVLHVINRNTWHDEPHAMVFDDYVDVLRFTPDNAALLWAKPTRTDATHGMPRDFVLQRYDLGTRTVATVAAFAPSFTPVETYVLRSEQIVAVYGVPVDANNLAEDAPHVVFFDLLHNRIVADLRLDGVQQWQRRIHTANTNGASFEINTPAVAWDHARDLLYIVHADENTITVVDVVQQQIAKQQPIVERQTGWEQILGWMVPRAHAKAVPGNYRQAQLSTDGTRLFVVGARHEWRGTTGKGWPIQETPLGLQVIDTTDVMLEHRLDLPINMAMMSPNGQHLLLWSEWNNNEGTTQSSGVYVIDAGDFQERVHLQPDTAFAAQGFSLDSRYAYVSHQTNEAEPSTIMGVLDCDTQRIVAERRFNGAVGYVLVP